MYPNPIQFRNVCALRTLLQTFEIVIFTAAEFVPGFNYSIK